MSSLGEGCGASAEGEVVVGDVGAGEVLAALVSEPDLFAEESFFLQAGESENARINATMKVCFMIARL